MYKMFVYNNHKPVSKKRCQFNGGNRHDESLVKWLSNRAQQHCVHSLGFHSHGWHIPIVVDGRLEQQLDATQLVAPSRFDARHLFNVNVLVNKFCMFEFDAMN